jgi:adenine-specific DNA-methyltransferase
LDPGAGVGSLAAALLCRVLTEAPGVEVEVIAVEVDPHVSTYLVETLADCEAAAQGVGAKIRTRIVGGDFIELCGWALETDPALREPFDLVIMNPPYAKLSASSDHRKSLIRQGVDCPNLYAAFLALGVSLDLSRGCRNR